MPKNIPLTQGKFTVVDDVDFETFSKFKWFFHKGYALRNSKPDKDGARTIIRLHREILSAPNGLSIDHINGNSLDNRKVNLRFCTHAENLCNRKVSSASKTGVKGVQLRANRFIARIGKNGKRIHLGSFKTMDEAISAYEISAIKTHGEFAKI